jgi:hypothetical protein
MEALKQGKLPAEYREIVQKEKKFTSKQAFIENKQLEYAYTRGKMIPRPPTAKPSTSMAKNPLSLNFQSQAFTPAPQVTKAAQMPMSDQSSPEIQKTCGLFTEREEVVDLVGMLNSTKPPAQEQFTAA